MMKKVSVLLLVCVILANMFSVGVFAQENIKVLVDGTEVSFDAQPYVKDGRIMVPVRAIFEALGASVEWNNALRSVTANKGINKVTLTVDYDGMDKNEISYTIDAPAEIKDGRTFVPLRTVSEALDCKVSWDESANTAVIESKVERPMEVAYTYETEYLSTDNPDVHINFGFEYPQIVFGKDFASVRCTERINAIAKDMTYSMVDYMDYAYDFWENWQYVADEFYGYPNVDITVKTELHMSEKYNTISLVTRVYMPYMGVQVKSRIFDADTCMEYMNIGDAVDSFSADTDAALCSRIYTNFLSEYEGVRYSGDINFYSDRCAWWVSDDKLFVAASALALMGVGRVSNYWATSIVP